MRAASHVRDIDRSEDTDEEFTRLYERYRRPLFVHCKALTGDAGLAEDIVHDTFVKVLVTHPETDASRSLWPLLLLIADRACIDAHRRRTYAHSRLEHVAANRSAVAEGPESSVLHRMEYEELQRAIAALPGRQRAALQLYAMDHWSYAEVAAHLGDSVASVKSLLQRARTRLRDTAQRPLAALVGSSRAWAARRHHARARLELAIHGWAERVGAEGVRVLVAGASTVSVLAAALYGLSPLTNVGAHAAEAPAVGAGVAMAFPPADSTVSPMSGVAPTSAASETVKRPERTDPPVAERGVGSVTASVFGPSEPTPENATLTRVEASPDYANDRTVVVSGSVGTVHSPALFVTHDGGASWRRPQAVGFRGAFRFLFPSGTKTDGRTFFALGATGLQVTNDGGDTFTTVLPGIYNDGAPAPAGAGRDHSMLLVEGGLLYEYGSDTNTKRLVQLGDQWESLKVESVRYERNDLGEPVAVVAGHRLSSPEARYVLDTKNTFISRCARRPDHAPSLPASLVQLEPVRFECEHTQLPDAQETSLALPKNPTSSMRFIGHQYDISVSTDGGRTFTPRSSNPLSLPMLSVKAVETLPVAGPGSAVAAGMRRTRTPGPALMRTDDGGRTWAGLTIPLPGFEGGTWGLGVTSTGRLFTTGVGSGSGGPVACSADGGRTWGTTCPTADTA